MKFVNFGSLLVLGSVAIVALIGCESTKKIASPQQAGWADSMQGLAADIREIIPYVYSKKNFFDPKNQKTIDEKLSRFSQQAHKITPKMGESFFGKDPMVNYSLDQMKDDILRSRDAFKLGQLEYSQSMAKSVVNHCFRCHSVVSVGSAAHWEVKGIADLDLKSLEKVDLMVATRQYDQAIAQLESMIKDADTLRHQPFEFEAALRKYLALMVRIKADPTRASERLEAVLQMNAPFYLAEQVRSWKKSLDSWSLSMKKDKARGAFVLGQDRMKKAHELQQYAKDHAGDVEFLRATSYLHEALKSPKASELQLAQAYLGLGEAYEILDELGYWNLHEVYYESCILKSPKSAVGRNCFRRLESSVYMGYSGSSGVHLPAQEKARLDRLKSLLE